ncbi:MAG: prolyl aminopeptidase, partial [Actinomycetota bacterium]|nr:prolyl aminopeptidase [Actinomycetota bacterium]
ETSGNPEGKPAIVLHGGPGSGCLPWHRRLFDPSAFRVVLFDQRGCGQSRPHASEPDTQLAHNNTPHVIADIELLRERLEIDRWLVWGGSWESTLALAYSQSHPSRVSEMILWGVTTGRRSEFDWLFRGGVAAFFPQQWSALEAALEDTHGDADIVEKCHRLLNDSDPSVRRRAAHAWCMWESGTSDWPPKTELADRFTDPRFALAYARIVTHYVCHNAWLEDQDLLVGAAVLADIPGTLVNGRFDFQAPLGNAWELQRVWTRAGLVIVEDAGHAPNDPCFALELVRASDRLRLG